MKYHLNIQLKGHQYIYKNRWHKSKTIKLQEKNPEELPQKALCMILIVSIMLLCLFMS